MSRTRRVLAGLGCALGWLLLTLALLWTSQTPIEAFRHAGDAPLDPLIGLAATVVAWILLTWYAVGVVLAIAMTTPRLGRHVRNRAVAVLVPQASRRTAAVLLGAVTVTASVSAPVLASPTPGARVAGDVTASATVSPLPAGWTPDRPVAESVHITEGASPVARKAATTRSTPSAAAQKRPSAAAQRQPSSAGNHVVQVRDGDTLWGIAARALGPGASNADIAAAWPRWYAANREVVGDDPGRIVPGLRLQPPPR